MCTVSYNLDRKSFDSRPYIGRLLAAVSMVVQVYDDLKQTIYKLSGEINI